MKRIVLLLTLFLISRAVLAQPSLTATVTPTETATFTTTPTVPATATPTATPVPTVPPTPAPTLDGFAIGGSGEVLFPQAVRFLMSMSRPLNELNADSIRLTIDTAAAEPLELNLELDDLGVSGAGHTHLEYFWQIPEDAIPPLFSAIDFEWEVQALDGELARVEGSLRFEDQRVVWVTSREADGNLTIVSARELPSGFTRDLLAVYELLAANTNQRPEVRLLIYDEAVAPGCSFEDMEDGEGETIAIGPFSGAVVECEPEFAERVYRESGYFVLQRLPGANVETQIVASMVRAFYEPLWDDAEMPPWFAAGLELLYAPALKGELLPTAQNAARINRLFTLDTMSVAPPDDDERAQIWQAQSYGMILYMVEQIGFEGVFSLAQTLGTGVSFADHYAQVMGEPLDALVPSWQRWIFTERAESVYGITAYQPATPTFTPTLTATLTRTPSATPTAAPSVTPTVTGVHSPTPFATVTPSSTPTPEPPTVTPRPPVRAATPAPDVSISAVLTPSVRAVIVIALLILIAVLVYVYIRVGRR